MISKTQLFLWDIQLSLVLANPKLFGALCCCRKALLCSNPREKGSKQGWWYPSSWDQTFQTSKIYTKSCPWKLRWVFLLTELVFPSLWQIPSSPFAQPERICPWKGLPWGMVLDFVGISTGKQQRCWKWVKTTQMALVGFALHAEELLNWWNYVTGETSCFCNYGDVCVCQETSYAAGLNWSN